MTESTAAQRASKQADKDTIRPFPKVNVPETDLTELRRRINATRWPERETITDATQGVQLAKWFPNGRLCHQRAFRQRSPPRQRCAIHRAIVASKRRLREFDTPVRRSSQLEAAAAAPAEAAAGGTAAT